MDNTFKNEWALILGGSSGLGLATAKLLAKKGYHIIVVHRDRRIDLPQIEIGFREIASSGVQFKSFNADATREGERRALLDKIGDLLINGDRIKVLVHSIAKGNLKPMGATEEGGLSKHDFTITLNAMALSLYEWTSDLLQRRFFASDARVISFTSEGSSKVVPNYAAVSSAKATLEAITRSMAIEFAAKGIKANCIQAGVTETPAFLRIPNSDKLKTTGNREKSFWQTHQARGCGKGCLPALP